MRLLLALLLLAPAALAQTAPEPGTLAAYQSTRLYIEGVETVTTNQYGQVLNTNRTWQPLQGDSRISEREFYELVGRDDLVAIAVKQEETRSLAFGGGLAATVIGTVAATIGGIQYLNTDYDSEASEAENSAGLIPLMVGTTVLTGGVLAMQWGLNLGKKRATHVQAAAEMAAVYNAQIDQQEAEPEPGPVIRDTRP